MAKNNNLGDFLKSLANKFRSATGTSDKINPQDFESKVDEVFNTGAGIGYDQGYDNGKQEAYDTFWDNFQKNGNRTEYEYAFAWGGWTNEIFKPKYDITVELRNSGNIFAYPNITGSLKTILNDCGVTLTFLQQEGRDYGARYIFVGTKFTELPVIDVSLAKGNQAMASLFSGSTLIQTIEKLIVPTDCTAYGTNTFNACYALENITIEGTIMHTLSFAHCPLSADSVYSILNHLDTNEYTGTRTITLKRTSKDAYQEKYGGVYEDDWDYWTAVLTSMGNWTFALV